MKKVNFLSCKISVVAINTDFFFYVIHRNKIMNKNNNLINVKIILKWHSFSIKALSWTLNAFLKRKLLNWSQKSF